MRRLRDHYLRIDARSLGLFRILFGVVLIADLFRRWKWVTAFYSNNGVLPNHNHIFNLRETGHVWSALHAVSTPGEAHVAFAVILLCYVLFTIGFRTRAFHLLALVGLVSLTARNVLLENAGSYVAIALLAFTAFLPTGRRFSLDALSSSLAARDEKHAPDLNDRSSPTDHPTDSADHGRGWSPVSLAAFAVLAQIALVYLCAAIQQNGSTWHDGTALYYALNLEPWVSRIGAVLRGIPAIVKPLSYLVYGAEWAIPALILLPVGRRQARLAAVLLVVLHALTIGLLLDFGLYAWSLLAAAPLLVTDEIWEHAIARGKRTLAPITVIYDADCGICLWLTRVLKRVDGYERIAFQGNDEIPAAPVAVEGEAPTEPVRAELARRDASGAIERSPMPAEVTNEMVLGSVVVVDASGKVFTRSGAVAEIVAALPAGRVFAAIMRLPGISHLLNVAYDMVAKRRVALSVLFGMSACGVPVPNEETIANEPPAPAARALFGVTGALREIAVAIVFVAMLAQTSRANHLPGGFTLPQGRFLSAVAAWPRMIAKWDVLSPAPSTEDGAYIVDAQTKAGASIDPITGREPRFDLGVMHGTGLGQLWADYLDRIHRKEWTDYQRAFRDYLTKGGIVEEPPPDEQIVGLDAYWVSATIPPPGESRPAEVTKDKLFTHSRGGRLNVDKLPLLRPDLAPSLHPELPALRR